MVEQQQMILEVTKEPAWIKLAVALIGVIGAMAVAWFKTRRVK